MFKTSVFPVPPGPKRTVTLRYSQLCRKTEGLTDFLFPLSTAKYTSHPVEKVAIDVTIESQEPIKNVYSPTHAVEIKRPDERHARITFASTERSSQRPISACSTTSGKRTRGRERVELSARHGRGRLFPAAGQPGDQAADDDTDAEDRDVRGRPLGQHERQEDRAGQGRAEVRVEQPAGRRPVQHHRLRQQVESVPARVAAIRRSRRATRRWASSKGFMPAAAPTSTARCRRRWRSCRMPAGRPTWSSSPTACPPPANPRDADRRQRQGRPTRSTRGSSPSAWATT